MLLYGMHDREGAHLVPAGGFCLDTIALSEKPSPFNYRHIRDDINWIVRLNWGYGSTGTYPPQQEMGNYIQRASDYVLASQFIYAYIPGNEPNHENERPGGVVISPKYAAEVFSVLRRAIRPFNRETLALTVPVAPYHASPMDWLVYLKEMFSLIANQGGADGIGIHAYVRGETPEAVYSSDRMGPPLTGQYNSFRTYRDALSVVPSSMKQLPAFITETNLLVQGGWPDNASGVIPAIYEEINTWNSATGTQKIFCDCIYRFPKYDKWHIDGKNGVIQDFQNAVAKGYRSPVGPQKEIIYQPIVVNNPAPPDFAREIDPRATARGVRIEEINLFPGEFGWKVKKIQWFDEQEADRVGPDHHILVDVLDEQGKRWQGVHLMVKWPGDVVALTTEAKLGEVAAANFPMSPSRNEFSVWVEEYPVRSEKVVGIGMGAETPSGFNAGIHTSTFVVFQYVKGGTLQSITKDEPDVRKNQAKNYAISLVHPVADPAYRRITQIFGVNGDYYKRFAVDGVPLKGHNGVDFGTPVGTKIQAVDEGVVVEKAFDPDGYGNYVKIVHSWGESLYAHLSDDFVERGQVVDQTEIVGLSGNTGISTGPHLHFGLRLTPYNRRDGWGGYTDPVPYLQQAQPPKTSDLWKEFGYIVSVLETVSRESGLDYELLASLAWAESSFRPDLEDGLFQIGDAAWADYAAKVGAKDRNNPLDNARVAAAYFKWLLSQTNNDIWKALYAWNWGIGNVLAGGEPPEITKTFANKVLHGRDLLKAIGD